jgi:uncharacterized protein YgiM (DUF1202 family)
MPSGRKVFIRLKIPSLEEVLKQEGYETGAIKKLLLSAERKYGDLKKLTPGSYTIPILASDGSILSSIDVEIPGPEKILPTLGYTGSVLQTILEILAKQSIRFEVGEYTLTLTLEEIPDTQVQSLYVKVRVVNFRSTPRTGSDNILGILFYGTRVTSLGEQEGIWYKTRLEDHREGWISGLVLSSTSVPTDLYVTKEGVELRSDPIDIEETILSTLPYGTHVRFTAIKGLWYQVQLDDGRKGWILGFGLSPEPPIPLPDTDAMAVITRKIFNITGAFEGGDGFSNLAGNFDGQGLSFGFLQWNFGQGSLQPLLKSMFAKNPVKFRGIFKDGTDLLLTVLNSNHLGTQIQFARSLNDSKSRILEPWRSRFKALGKEPEFQDIQIEFAKNLLNKAKGFFKEYQLKTERGLSLMFDIVVQNGSIDEKTKLQILEARKKKEASLQRQLSEREFLEIIAHKRAEAANPRWVEDVRSRKLTIARGEGEVHGKLYNLEQEFGLGDQVIFV